MSYLQVMKYTKSGMIKNAILHSLTCTKWALYWKTAHINRHFWTNCIFPYFQFGSMITTNYYSNKEISPCQKYGEFLNDSEQWDTSFPSCVLLKQSREYEREAESQYDVYTKEITVPNSLSKKSN